MKNHLTRFALGSAMLLSAVIAMPAQALEKQASAAATENVGQAIDPVAAVRRLYTLLDEPIVASPDGEDIADPLPMTQRLESLFLLERDYLEASGHPFDRMDFSWVVNGQDSLITDMKITSVDVPIRDYGDRVVDQFPRKIVTASFKNFDDPTTIRYYWVQQRNGWKLHNATGTGDDGMTWTLSLLLEYGG